MSVISSPRALPSYITSFLVKGSSLAAPPAIVTSASMPLASVISSRAAMSSGLYPKAEGTFFAMLYIIRSDIDSPLVPVISLTVRLGSFNSSGVNFL